MFEDERDSLDDLENPARIFDSLHVLDGLISAVRYANSGELCQELLKIMIEADRDLATIAIERGVALLAEKFDAEIAEVA